MRAVATIPRPLAEEVGFGVVCDVRMFSASSAIGKDEDGSGVCGDVGMAMESGGRNVIEEGVVAMSSNLVAAPCEMYNWLFIYQDVKRWRDRKGD
jgi:hypothetical protein